MISPIAQNFIDRLQAMNPDTDVEYLRTDDLGPHFVEWVEKSHNGIYFYIDEINVRIVVESIGLL